MLIHRLQFMKEDYKEDLTIYQQQLSQVIQSLAPSFQNPRYTHARDPNERNKKLLKKVSQVISGYLTRFGKSYVHLVFLLQTFFSMGAPTNSGARGPPTAKSGPAEKNGLKMKSCMIRVVIKRGRRQIDSYHFLIIALFVYFH